MQTWKYIASHKNVQLLFSTVTLAFLDYFVIFVPVETVMNTVLFTYLIA